VQEDTSAALTLAAVLQKLRQKHGAQANLTYSRLWNRVVSGEVPSIRCGREYRVAPEHVEIAAEALRLTRPADDVA
jgi:hypothetical protein